MRGATLIAAARHVGLLSVCSVTFGSLGCAAVFRDSKSPVHVESDPPGATVAAKEGTGATPFDVPVPRSGITELRVTMPGFEEHHALVRKRVNGWWLTLDLATCIVPMLLCVPLFVDADQRSVVRRGEKYRARLCRSVRRWCPATGRMARLRDAPADAAAVASRARPGRVPAPCARTG